MTQNFIEVNIVKEMNSFVASIHYLQIASALGKKNCEAPSRVSIYTAELYALTLALGLVRKLRNSQSVIYSDSLFALQAISNLTVHNELVYKILKEYSDLMKTSKILLSAGSPDMFWKRNR